MHPNNDSINLRRRGMALRGFAAALAVLLGGVAGVDAAPGAQPERLKVLFLGAPGKLESNEKMADVTTRMLDRNIEVFYSEDQDILQSVTLPGYHAVMVFGDHKDLAAANEAALVKYVEGGRGMIAVHTGGMNFPGSKAWVQLVGARSKADGPAAELTSVVDAKHPLMAGHQPFTCWDVPLSHSDQVETGRTVIETRKRADGRDEPVSWVRTQGKGKIFYTAWGGDYRTWINEGFTDLLERAIRWTAGQDVPVVMASRQLFKPFKFEPAKVPYRRPSDKEHFDHPDIPKEPWTEKQLPLTPEESMRRMVTPAGFEVQLFASEPDIRKAIAMDWDERGRLWVAETLDYPNELRKQGGRDRISICEDTNGDGKADKFTVFAENLNIPTSITFWNGGAIVHQAPYTLFLKDTDGDDKADVRQVLLEGWGLRDTHAGPNHLNYGLDNWIWGSVGYSAFTGKVGGEAHDFGNAQYRFKPDGSKMEFLGQGYRNLMGFGFTEEGDRLGTGANGGPSLTFPLARRFFDLAGVKPGEPTPTYNSARGLPIFRRFRQNNGYLIYTAGTGHYVYTARTYPQEYWNRIAFLNEPTLGVVGQFTLKNDGCAYKTVNHSNLVASDDEYFSPIVSKVGPDGAVWVLDWYNFIIQHNPAPPGFKIGIANAYETELRDQKHGRVYRIVYTGAKPEAKVSLDKASPAELVKALTHPNMLWRLHAQRLLVERKPAEAVAGLVALLNDTTVDAVGQNPGALHAARTLSGMGALDNPGSEAFKAVAAALKHPSRAVRSHAVRSLPGSEAGVQAIIASGILGDKEAKVQLAAYEALADASPSQAAGAAVCEAFEKLANDRWVKVAATAAARRHSVGFLAAAKAKAAKGELAALAKQIESAPAPEPTGANDDAQRLRLELGLVPGAMKFDKEKLTVKAGQKVLLVFKNNDLLEHNVVVVKPGALQKVGALADKLAATPGTADDYVPESPDVVVSSRVLDPDQSQELRFTAPDAPGEYPFMCTFPGHWQLMRGVLVVEPAK